MKCIRLLLVLVLALSVFVPFNAAFAGSTTVDIVIAQVQPGASTAASQEYVSLYNNSPTDIDVTGWCLRYNGSNTKPGCIISPDPQTKLILAAKTYTTFASNEFMAAHGGFTPQAHTGFSGGMSDSAGTLTLVDTAGLVHDQFSWAAKAGAGKIFQRQNINPDTLKDTDLDSDFVQTTLQIPTALGLYEQAIAIDMCPNIEGQQADVPAGYLQDQFGDCVWDICPNIAGLQAMLPDGYELDAGVCVLIPLEGARVDITELLPNVSGSDTGHEYVELYNPNNRPIKLNGYRIQYGPDFVKSYAVPAETIEAGSYMSFSDTDLGLVLPNTSLQIRLVAPNGDVVSSTETYTNPDDDYAWALIDGLWKFTNVPTPAAANVGSLVSPGSDTAVLDQAVCPPGKYRNSETNRCRSISIASSVSSACGTGEYRNPTTNRCRKLGATITSELTPCRPGQERNPETNRCRSEQANNNDTKACAAGQERNPETNRCRAVTSSNQSKLEEKKSTSISHTKLVLIVLGVVMTLGYAAYEYRYDVVNLYLRLRAKRRKPGM